MADEERSRNRDARDRDGRGDDFPRSDRGPPPVANSRFAAAAEADRSYQREDNRGPPPVANSRFAAAAALAEEERPPRRDERGPPPVTNSRFAAAAALAEEERPPRRDERGPPPVANSRFAAAAAMAEEEAYEYEQRRAERDSFYGRDGDRGGMRGDRDHRGGGPPVPQNSRFAAAVAADEDYMPREERERRRNERDQHYDDRDNYGRGGDDYDRRGDGGPPRRGGYDSYERNPSPPQARVAEILKPKAPPPTENILKAPVKPAPEHEANMLQLPVKPLSKDEDEDLFAAPKKKAEPEPVKKEEPPAPALNVNSDELLAEFISGKKQGDDLKQWVEENRVGLPAVEKLVYELLMEHEKLNPDPDCGWAEPTKFGAALLALVEDDVLAQMQVLWGIQFYCDKLGFPKLNDEAVVQSMFRSMYKFDLAEADAFTEWKEDESDEHEKGKINAVIQTVEWFNWLEEDDEDEEEEEYEEE